MVVGRAFAAAPLEFLAEALLHRLGHRPPEDRHDGVGRQRSQALDRVAHRRPLVLGLA